MIRKQTLIVKNTEDIDKVYKREKKVSTRYENVAGNWKRNLR